MHVVLIGARASGKTSVGCLLASQLGLPFVDLDDRALSRFEEQSVAQVWERHGEAAWRDAEAAALEDLLDESDRVIALGGGTPMIDRARRTLEQVQANEAARIIYLRCPGSVLQHRLRQETGDRPSLTGDDPAAEIIAILAAREPVYSELAGGTVDASASVEAVVAEIIARIDTALD